ncbi:MAG: helix-turn-helix domain-containing protein [Tatlockia sp.]|nr:helix-turn-helix domain-containing protein [Tatlockia sp.]
MNEKKFTKLVGLIYDNIDKPITLEEIALKSGLSLASMKRLCEQAINQSPGAFIRRLRMELAFRSLQSRETSVLEVALASGFEDQSSFARRFKETFGFSPTQAREKMKIVSELESVVLEEPDIVELEALNLQAVTETGYYFEAAPKAWKGLKEKLSLVELADDFSGVFVGIGHDNPHEGLREENKCRFSACISHATRDLSIDKFIIAGGIYARFRYLGKPNNLGLAYHYIFGQWEDKSDVKINKEKPAFILFDIFPEASTEHKLMIHVPLLE